MVLSKLLSSNPFKSAKQVVSRVLLCFILKVTLTVSVESGRKSDPLKNPIQQNFLDWCYQRSSISVSVFFIKNKHFVWMCITGRVYYRIIDGGVKIGWGGHLFENDASSLSTL